METAPSTSYNPNLNPSPSQAPNAPAAAKAALGLMAADARFLLKGSKTPFFDQAIQFDENEQKIEPTNGVFLKKGTFSSGSKATHWDIMTKDDKGEDVRVVMGGPLCMTSSAFINKLGNFGIDMAYTPDTEAKASYYFEVADQSYFEEGAQNDHVLEFYSWWKRMRLWGFKTAMEDSKFTNQSKEVIQLFEKSEKKTYKDWTMAEWIDKAENVAKFAPLRRNKRDELVAGLEAKMFFDKTEKPGEKRKATVRSSIPEIAAVEEKYGVTYNNLPIFRLGRDLPKSKGDPLPLIELTDKEKWDGTYFGNHVVYWPLFTAQFSDNGKGVVNLKLHLNKLVVMGRAKCPLPSVFGPRLSIQVDPENEAYKDFVRKQAEAEAEEAFREG